MEKGKRMEGGGEKNGNKEMELVPSVMARHRLYML